jgi:anti-anti-sigma factor
MTANPTAGPAIDPAAFAVTLKLSGELDTDAAPEVGSRISRAVLEAKGQRILVDLAEVTFCGVAGLRSLLALDDDERQDRVAYANPGPMVRRLFSIVDPLGHLTVLDDAAVPTMAGGGRSA